MREYLDIFDEVLSAIVSRQITETELWGFLSCFVYIHFDLEHEGGRDLAYQLNRANDQLIQHETEEASNVPVASTVDPGEPPLSFKILIVRSPGELYFLI